MASGSYKDIDWAGIEQAAAYIGNFLEQWSLILVFQTKEKYGRACVYCSGPENAWQQLVYRRAYENALVKYPRLEESILGGADWPEFLQYIEEDVHKVEWNNEVE